MYELGYFDASVEPGTNILLAGPPLTGKRRVGLELLAAGTDTGEGVIVISVRDSADRIRTEYETVCSTTAPDRLGVVDAVTRHRGQSVTETEQTKYTESPGDVAGIGVKFSEFIESYYADRGIERNRVFVDSLTTSLLYANLQTVFRFLHAFTSRVQSADALGVYTIESTAHDEETLNTVEQLFDGVVRFDTDGVAAVDLPETSRGTPAP